MLRMQTFEQLGLFYLGKQYDASTRKRLEELVLYDSKDLVTHAVCVGMTGSGKTGLGIVLIEEAAIDGIPVLAIDPKGDLANLLLTFPSLTRRGLRAVGRPGDALRARQADARRVRAPRGRAMEEGPRGVGSGRRPHRATEGGGRRRPSSRRAAAPARRSSILKSLAAPPDERRARTAAARVASSGRQPARARRRDDAEAATAASTRWSRRSCRTRASRARLDLPWLVQQIQKPPFDRVGVLDLETFFPAKDRFGAGDALQQRAGRARLRRLARRRSRSTRARCSTPPTASRASRSSRSRTWATPSGCSSSRCCSTQLVEWMRGQRGTTSLRALLYMDEVFGYLPPVANPPSKAPLLTLLKQARAFGVGVVLATQNPVDLDYKALSNTGTWFLGRLQTERDKARVLDGLEGVRRRRARSSARSIRCSPRSASRVFLHAQRARARAGAVRDALDAVLPAWAARAGRAQTATRDNSQLPTANSQSRQGARRPRPGASRRECSKADCAVRD